MIFFSTFKGLVVAALLVLGCALASAPAAAQDADDGETRRQILVMLRMPAPHLRLNEGYGGQYGDSAIRAALNRTASGIARRAGLRIVGEWPMPLLGVDCFMMEVPASVPLEEAVQAVSRHRAVAWAQPVQTYRSQVATQAGDRLFAAQPTASQWHLADLHRLATGRGVTVAVVDSGVDLRHPDLAGQFASAHDFVDGGAIEAEVHGTGVAGVIAARRNNGVGIVGVAPSARVIALRACRQTSGSGAATCNTLNLARALHYAIQSGAGVINLSLSGPRDTLLERLIAIAVQRRTIVVAAYDPGLPGGGFPASEPGVVPVGDAALPSLPAAVYGAPARGIPTTAPGGTWDLVSGTSYAAAQVSGLMALLRERGRPARLVRTHGAVDACASLVDVTPSCDCACAIVRRAGGRTQR